MIYIIYYDEVFIYSYSFMNIPPGDVIPVEEDQHLQVFTGESSSTIATVVSCSRPGSLRGNTSALYAEELPGHFK